jgi:hypothetical protein
VRGPQRTRPLVGPRGKAPGYSAPGSLQGAALHPPKG